MTQGASAAATDLEGAVGRAAGPPPAALLQLHLRAQLLLVLLHDVREVGPPAALRVVLLTMAAVRLGAGRGHRWASPEREPRPPQALRAAPPCPARRARVRATHCAARARGVNAHALCQREDRLGAAGAGPQAGGATPGVGNTFCGCQQPLCLGDEMAQPEVVHSGGRGLGGLAHVRPGPRSRVAGGKWVSAPHQRLRA